MDILQVYNPANKEITADEIEAMKNLTDDEIAQLAKAYPNTPTGNAYLVYFNTSETQTNQRFPLGTWANLHNLRLLGRKDIVPYNFTKNHAAGRSLATTVSKPDQKTVDLSKEDAGNAEGLKKAEVVPPAQIDASDTIETAADTAADAKIAELEKELNQAIADKAHPKIIKGLQETLATAKK